MQHRCSRDRPESIFKIDKILNRNFKSLYKFHIVHYSLSNKDKSNIGGGSILTSKTGSPLFLKKAFIYKL